MAGGGSRLTPAYHQRIEKQKKEIEELEKRISELQAKVQTLR